MKPLFITLEGPEGSGKTTHAKNVAEYLRERKLEVVVLHEPGGTRIGEEIRTIVLNSENREMLPKTELFLFLASRSQLIGEVILPALTEGKCIVCDRFTDATLAYQTFGRGINEKVVRELNELAAERLRPDLTILLDIETPVGLSRAKKTAEAKGQGQPDRMEADLLSFHEKVRRGYFSIARADPSRIKLINVEEDIKKTWGSIKKCIDGLIK